MSRITRDSSIDRIKDIEEMKKFVSIFFDQLIFIINNGQSFADNFDCKIVSVAFTSANIDTTVPHGLDRVPSSYLVLSRSANMVIYDGQASWTSSNLYLRSSATGSITMAVF